MSRDDSGTESAAKPPLVPLSDRDAFELALQDESRAARKAFKPLTIAFCKIERIKLICDAHGQDVVQRVIQAVARSLLSISGENCLVAHDGGEELLVLFRGIPCDQACQMLNQLGEKFARRRLIDSETRSLIGKIAFSYMLADALAWVDPHGLPGSDRFRQPRSAAAAGHH